MIVGRFPDAGEECLVAAGNQHQRAVIGRVVRQQHRHGQRAHARHAVFHMPGFKIAVPEKFLAGEAGLIVEARLVNVDAITQQELRDAGQTAVGGQATDHIALRVNLEDRADFLAARLDAGLGGRI